MRRVYFTDPKKARLRQEMMANYREARKNIDPALLERAREIIHQSALHHAPDLACPESHGDIPVDHQKNLATVKLFLEMAAEKGNVGIVHKIRTMMVN